jgi:hypothetical protein
VDGDVFAHGVETEHLNFKLPIAILEPVQLVLALIARDGSKSNVSLRGFYGGSGNGDAVGTDYAGLGSYTEKDAELECQQAEHLRILSIKAAPKGRCINM